MELIIPRPNGATDLRLYPVERVMPLIKRYTTLSPPLAEVLEAVGECQEEIGHNYGCEYLALLPVERDGMAYLPLNARKVIGVYPAPWTTESLDYNSTWHPNRYPRQEDGRGEMWPGREWVADQIGGLCCYRSAQLEAIAHNPALSPLEYSRTGEGIYIPRMRERISGMVKHVVIVYDAELTDSRGYPLVNDRDARAAAYYWNWQRLTAMGFGGEKVDPNLLNQAAQLMYQYVDQARIGDGLTDADWRLIQRTSASWDRTTFREGLAGPSRWPTASARGRSGWADGGY